MKDIKSTVLQDSTNGGNNAPKESRSKAKDFTTELKVAKRAKSCDGDFQENNRGPQLGSKLVP